jgi:hypothetical protein
MDADQIRKLKPKLIRYLKSPFRGSVSQFPRISFPAGRSQAMQLVT